MNTEIQGEAWCGAGHLSHETAPCRAKLMIILGGPCLCPGIFPAEFNHPKHELEAGWQLVLQATSSAKGPKTMNTEIQRGVVQSGTPLTPNGPLQGEVDDHF